MAERAAAVGGRLAAGPGGAGIPRSRAAAVLRHAVRMVASGDALLSPGVTRRLIAEFATRPAREPPAAARVGVLTDRAREVLALVGDGLANEAIAKRLFMASATVKTHVSRIMGKLGAHDRAQLVVIACETGLVQPGWL